MKKEKYIWWAVGATVLLFIWWIMRRPTTPLEMVEETAPQNMQFYEPYYFTTPGIADLPLVLNGADSPYQSEINVYLSNPALGALTNNYIPMFGFVGVTAVGAQ